MPRHGCVVRHNPEQCLPRLTFERGVLRSKYAGSVRGECRPEDHVRAPSGPCLPRRLAGFGLSIGHRSPKEGTGIGARRCRANANEPGTAGAEQLSVLHHL